MLTEIFVVFQRQMRIMLRNPIWVMFGLTQPILYLALFGPLLKGVTGSGLGSNNAWQVFVPGLLLQLVIFGAGFAGFGIIREIREGVIDRQRVTPARRLSLIAGRTLANMVTIAVQGVVLILVALPLGLRASWVGVSSSLALICLLAMGISAASYAAGLTLKSEDAFSPVVQGLSLPLLLLSGVLLPMSVAPAWLRHTSQANPLTYVVDATRSLFRGDLSDSHVWIGSLVTVVMGVLLAWWGTRTFQRQSS
ncbi:MAG: ABC transporter permease [Jatrophihabitans sp.]